MQHEKHGYKHCDIGCNSRTFNSHIKNIHKGWCKKDIQSGTYEHCCHSTFRSTGSPDDVVKTKTDISEQQTGQDISHKLASIRQSDLAGTKGKENIIKENCQKSDVNGTIYECKRECITQYTLCRLVIVTTKQNGNSCRRTATHKHTDSRGYIHHRESYRKSCNSLRSNNMTDNHTVYDIIKRHHQHSYHSGQTVFPKKPCHRTVC